MATTWHYERALSVLTERAETRGLTIEWHSLWDLSLLIRGYANREAGRVYMYVSRWTPRWLILPTLAHEIGHCDQPDDLGKPLWDEDDWGWAEPEDYVFHRYKEEVDAWNRAVKMVRELGVEFTEAMTEDALDCLWSHRVEATFDGDRFHQKVHTKVMQKS